MQEGVTVADGVIGGTLHYVTGYTGFSGLPEEQEGNYLAVHAAAEDATSIAVRPLGGTQDPAELDSDGLYILKVGPNAKGLEYYTTVDGVTYCNIFRFENLIREAEDED